MDDTQAFSCILREEIEVLEQIPPIQVLIRTAVINRQWDNYHALMQSVGEVGDRFDALEAQRDALFKRLAEGSETFYAWAARLEGPERDEISNLYRKLKMTSLQIKISNDTIMEYLREVKTAISGYLEQAYPSRRGRLYSRTGVERQADMCSVVINSSL